ncbi:hypothetical protein KVV02_002184 [Mortierella alpina]|uniref:Uncharacterized protein n=1 Tax=Mortierella alpina TaxID=64518 RepID=A0A9P8A8G7_MORAP|nr:hypothetical protein KVV02_002184 [Mortierella alpina]
MSLTDMLPTFAHLQKDDSKVPLLPYATGCFLASILLTISGIAETHPHALTLATYLIQCGWLLLHIQGALLVQQYGNHSQCMTLFKVWLVAVQMLDVHRRFLDSALASSPSLFDDGTSSGSQSAHGSIMEAPGESAGHRQGYVMGGTTLNLIRTYYLRMLCSAIPTACRLSFTSASSLSANPHLLYQSVDMHTGVGSRGDGAVSTTPSTASSGATGMREMEYLVLFEILAGLGVSSVMCLVWLAMALNQGAAGSTSPSVRGLSATLHRSCKTAKATTMAMDTALVNSWYEVKPSKHHLHHGRHPHRQSASPTLALSSRDHLSPSPSSLHMHHDSYCRSLLDPHPRNSLDWLKCLMQTSPHPAATASGKDQGRSRQLRKKSLRTMLGTHVDFGLAGEAVSRRTESHGTGHCSLEVEEVAATSSIMMSSGACCGQSYRLQQPATLSATSSSCFVLRGGDHAGPAPRGEGLTSHAASTSPCNSASSTAAWTAAARPSPIVSASMAASVVVAVAAHSASETETGPANPLVGEQPTAPAQSGHHKSESGPGTRNGSARSSMAAPSASSNSQRPVSATTAVSPSSSPSCTPPHVHAHTNTGGTLTNTHTDSDHATSIKTNAEGASAPTPSPIDANATSTSISTATSTSTSTSTSSLPSSSHHSVLILLSSSAFIHSALEMTQKGLSRSKDATTAFLYRTFSPTYRICRLYVDSWNNGTQRRGLERIKTSVVRGDAFTLVRNTTTQMQDVWRRVMVAYSVKAANARAKVMEKKMEVTTD